MEAAQNLFEQIGLQIKNAKQSQMFGKPCFKINGKAFICFFQSEMVFKLTGKIHSKALNLKGAQLFDPSGKKRPMKEWIQVPFEHHETWMNLALEAKEYVDSMNKAGN